MDKLCNAKLTRSINGSVRARLKGMVVGGSDAVMIPDLEYITDVFINEDGDLILTTNYSREINAGAVPHGPMGPAGSPGSPGPAGPPGAAGAGLLLVNFHQEDGVWLASKSVNEIKLAISNGDTVVCEYESGGNYLRGQLVLHSEEGVVFMCHWGIEDHFFTMYADDGRIVYGKAENSTDGQDPSTLFKITITESGGTYTADKTFTEAKAALDEGNVVVAEWTNLKLRGQLTGYADDLLEFTFHSFMGTDEYLILQNDNTVTHLVSEVGEEKIPSRVIVKKTDASLQVTATVDGVDQVTAIALNEDGDPVSVTKDGKTTTLIWEGFE